MSVAHVPAVEASIKFVQYGEKAVFYPTNRAKSYWPGDEHRVSVHDMRPIAGELALEKNGFVLVREPTKVTQFADPQQMRDIYYPEIHALLKKLTGADKVIAFGEMVRGDRSGTSDGALPSYGAHVDYQDVTVREFATKILGEPEAQRRLAGRYMLVNVWRPIKTVERTPLAVCDASTVKRSDLHDSEVRGGLGDPNRPSMWGFNLSYNPDQRWYYAPRMQPDEVLAFKLFDSDAARIQWTGHTAFDDPNSAPDAPPRESIEIRTISFLPK